MTIRETLQRGRRRLAEAGIADAGLEAEVLLMDAISASRAFLYTYLDRSLAPDEIARYEAALERRVAHEPVAYIVGTREFFGHQFAVDRRVLIPRPETEILVETALRLLGRMHERPPVVADVGTGSGAIAISLALARSDARVYGIDRSRDALAVAAANAERHRVADRVQLLHGDLLTPLPEPVDLIVANLPYIPTSMITTLAPEIREYEPLLALEGGPTGLELIDRLLQQAPAFVRPTSAIALEVGAGQAAAVVARATEIFPHARVWTVPDLAGQPRVVVIT